MMEPLHLHILSPESTLVDKAVSSVTLPGVVGPFMVLQDHAPLISALDRGEIVYVSEGKEERIPIASGFVEVKGNRVETCVEL